MKKVAFYTLGCKVNQYETEAVSELFKARGYEQVDFSDFADVYVINTCTVTSMSDRKSRQIIRRAKKKNESAIVIVMGCYSQTAPEDVLKIEGVNIILGTKDRATIVDYAESTSVGEVRNFVSDIMKTRNFEDLCVNTYSERTRAFIKIQEGCNQFCSYCIIPYARGPVRSRPEADVIDEVKRLSDKGFSEIVLTGIHVASYGVDLGNTNLAELILKIDKIDNIKRIRLSSIEPMAIDDVFLKTISKSEKVCHHFHLSLQSGCDETLKRMNRKYTTDEYFNIIKTLRDAFPDVAITTDIMVGFAGETDEEFEKSLEFYKKCDFAEAHVFQYSKRKGTMAAKRPDQIEPFVKEERSKRVIELAELCKTEFLKKFVGKTMSVLFEQENHKRSELFEGKTSNYITVLVKTDSDLSRKILDVKLTEITGDGILGELV